MSHLANFNLKGRFSRNCTRKTQMVILTRLRSASLWAGSGLNWRRRDIAVASYLFRVMNFMRAISRSNHQRLLGEKYTRFPLPLIQASPLLVRGVTQMRFGRFIDGA